MQYHKIIHIFNKYLLNTCCMPGRGVLCRSLKGRRDSVSKKLRVNSRDMESNENWGVDNTDVYRWFGEGWKWICLA